MRRPRTTPIPGAGDDRQPLRRLAGVVVALAGLAALAGLDAGAAAAQARSPADERLSPEFRRCMSSGDAAGGVTSAMLDCIGLENVRQDRRLNGTYRAAMARRSAKQQSALRVSERGWIAERKARCDVAAADEEGGSLAAVIYSRCMLDETVKRTVWLEANRP